MTYKQLTSQVSQSFQKRCTTTTKFSTAIGSFGTLLSYACPNNAQKQILEVESGIKCHHDVADDFHERDKLTQLCNDLIWDSCLESSSDCYIPEEYSQDLGKRPQVALEAEQHSLSRDKFPHRRLAYHSEARILGTGGSIGKLVFCYLIGDLLLLCQYLSPHKRK